MLVIKWVALKTRRAKKQQTLPNKHNEEEEKRDSDS
jgi:hypothetical protein